MATRRQRGLAPASHVKDEASALEQDAAADEALEAAERKIQARKAQAKALKNKKKKPERANSADAEMQSDDDDESVEDDSYGTDSFIANDEEVEAELQEAYMRTKKQRKEDKPPKEKKPKEKRTELDEEDYELLAQNNGLLVPSSDKPTKSRLIRNDVKNEETVQIDTTTKEVDPRATTKSDPDNVKQRLELDDEPEHLRRRRQTKVDRSEAAPARPVKADEPKISLKEIFNADEIDDPFNTEQDRQIAASTIPERLQVKLDGRLGSNQQLSEFAKEAEWILDRLQDIDHRYRQMINAKDVREKVCKVLKLLRSDHCDVPMICKYRKYQYATELDEDAVWHIYNLDQEYGRFTRNRDLIADFLNKVFKFDNKNIMSYIDELQYARSQSELNNFNALIRHLRFQFSDQLSKAEEQAGQLRKQPQSRDEIQISRTSRVHEFSRLCFLEYGQFQDNLQQKKLIHSPPEPRDAPSTVAAQFMSKFFSEDTEFLQAACRYAANELAAQPVIRNMMKKQLREHGTITTTLTEQGRKDLDIFHHSYRVKLVDGKPLKELDHTDLYLDIQQCERSNLVSAKIELQQLKYSEFKSFLEEHYFDIAHREQSWSRLRAHVIKTLLDDILQKELIKEVRDELQQEAETFVINNCKRAYSEQLMNGPFHKMPVPGDQIEAPEVPAAKLRRNEDIIKPKERLVVMGALMHQIDANNYMVTVAVVDKYGELIAHKDFMRLLPPRKRKPRTQPGFQPSEQQMGEQPKTEEELEHERDSNKLIEILDQHSVDVIVVAANSLEARNLKNQMFDLSEKSKARKKQQIQESGSKRQGPAPVPKEACVIWGSTEVPKLFALSHNSQKLHKGVQQILKQTISLARYEQDPMMEILNLWSPITAENQALALNLDPMQKLVNQSRLADGLEEVNIRCVNKVGVDLNIVVNHEHMHCVIQFLSGLGPRMAKRLLANMKQIGNRLVTRGEMLKSQLVPLKVYMSLGPFVMIKIPEEEQGRNDKTLKMDILDQTRIHHEHYKVAMKIASDACYGAEGMDGQEVEKTDQILKCKEVIARPSQLKNLDLKTYYQQLAMSNQGNMCSSIDLIIEEFKAPFADPRQPRSLTNPGIGNERLFYMLIDESKRTFKRGLVVTGTVSAVLEQRVICKLENGLTATIVKEKILDADSNEKLKDTLDINYVITGRIERILTEEGEQRFEVQLSCKKGDMISHERYLKELAESLGIDPRMIREEDKRNLNFADDQKPKTQSRFTPRRIAHEKFKNISSRRALAELENAEVGEFVFRPSTRSEDALTLTWKFWRKHFAHIEIHELEKQPGDAIGRRLMISNENFENLREIVERYIIPCNRLVREVKQSVKWCDADCWEDLEQRLKEEKNTDKGRIPYRFAILPQYQQHIVLAYVPKNEVVKEFIKVRPRGYYFHEQNLAPFMQLVNWFKENFATKDYQKFLRRQRSPRTTVHSLQQQIKETPAGDNRYQNEYSINQAAGGHQWGGGSVHSNQGGYGGIKQEQQRSYGRGQRRGMDSPGYPMKYEAGGRSPAAWTQDARNDDVQMHDAYGGGNNYDQRQRGGGDDRPRDNRCFRCQESGHFAKDCPNPDTRPGGAGGQKPRGCFNCQEEGHIARDCPQERRDNRRGGPGGGMDGSGYKRQRTTEGTSLKRNADGGYDLSANWGAGNDGGNQGAWGNDLQAQTPKPDHDNWGNN